MSAESKTIVVVGGGISGMTAAVEASEAGGDVVVVERNPYLGGRVAQSYQYFPKLCPPMCGLEISLKRIRTTDRIRIMTMAEVERISGEAGEYTVTVKHHPRYVNDKCTVCGKCAEVCPVERSNPFNWGLDKTKAAYLPFEAAYPQRFVIDMDVCKGEACSKCVEACAYDAIDLKEKPSTEEIKAGAVVFAQGWRPYDANKLDNLGFGRFKNVVNNAMMERMAAKDGPMGGEIKRPDGGPIGSVAFVHCAGSRDENHLKHCSGVCCVASLKQARYVRAQYPDADIYVFYIDVRAPGRLEDFYAEMQDDPKLHLIKGKVAKVEEDAATGDLVVEAEDVFGGGVVRQQVNMVVLATGIEASPLGDQVEGLVERDEHGFLVPEQPQAGFIAAGCAKRPIDVAACVRDATGAALKALQNCE